ncbi:MAG: M15 family metallopeptidase [Faecalibacterium sp.]
MQEREIAIDPSLQKPRYSVQQRAEMLRAKKKRRAERRRNQIIFLGLCAVALILIIIGIVKGAMLAFSALRVAEWPAFSLEDKEAITTQGQVQTELDAATEAALQETVSYDISDYEYDASDARLILVNTNLLLSEDYTLPELAVADDATGITLAAQAAESYRAMASAALADGISLTLIAGYHDAETQQTVFETWQQFYLDEGYTADEAYDLAQEVVAEPNASEHQTGYGADILSADYTAQDIGYADTVAFAWLSRYAAEYGFILRYPEDKQMITGRAYEPWHWRYVGVENAKAIVESGLTLEEFIEAEGVF